MLRNQSLSLICTAFVRLWETGRERKIKNENIDVCKTQMPPFPNIWTIGLTFDLLTWVAIGISNSTGTIYLQSLKLVGQSVLELSVAQCVGDWHDLWPTDLNINRGHLLIKDYLRTKFEASGTKRSWVISCTKLRDTDIPTDMCNAICPFFFEGGT